MEPAWLALLALLALLMLFAWKLPRLAQSASASALQHGRKSHVMEVPAGCLSRAFADSQLVTFFDTPWHGYQTATSKLSALQK